MTYICHCVHMDGKVYPDPNHTCPNGHTRGDTAAPMTEQDWLGNIPADRQPRSRAYLMPLPHELAAAELFAHPGEGPITALPPITVTVTEEVTLKYGPRKPIIHWEDVPAFSESIAVQAMLRQALELRAAGIEPVFTMNGKVVDLNGPIDPNLP